MRNQLAIACNILWFGPAEPPARRREPDLKAVTPFDQ